MHKKLFAAGLAVLMVVSMLACFVLPSTAASLDDNQHYYVRTAADWVKLAGTSTDENYWVGKTIHLENDIDFTDVKVGQFPFTVSSIGSYTYVSDQRKAFKGTLDGHGHTIKNISLSGSNASSGSLFYEFGSGAVIKNLKLDSTCTFKNTSSTGVIGAFAAKASGATIYNCSTKATVNTTKSDGKAGGFIGDASGGLTIDSCLFEGTVTVAGTVYGALVAAGTPTVKNTIVMNLTDAYCSVSNNSYASVTEENALQTAWTVNTNHIATANPQVYFSADINGNLLNGCFKEERIVQVTTVNGNSTTTEYYAPRMVNPNNANALSTQTQITPAAAEAGQAIEVTGAQFENGIIYVDYQDVLVKYVDTTTDQYKFDQAKAKLQELVDAYSALDSKYFNNWSEKQNWLSGAKYTLNTATKASQLQVAIDGEASVKDSVASMSYPNYPSLADYNIYKLFPDIKNYSVGSAEEWLAAVEMSDFVHNDQAVSFSGITIHLTKDIEMGNTAMHPLCYGDICDANFNGHDFAFANINIQETAPFGPVGLIAHIGKTAAKNVYNLGISGGTVKTVGTPRYKLHTGSTDSGNKTGGICGRAHKSGAIFRKCWNGANITSNNQDSTAGIIADARNTVTVDSCFNVGRSSNYGISGYGQVSEKVYNSFSGAGAGHAVNISLNMLGNPRTTDEAQIQAKFDEHFKNVHSVIRPTLSLTHISSDATQAAIEKKAGENWNARYKSSLSNAEAAWKIMQNYLQQNLGTGERIYFTLKNGEVAFGTKENQIRRITLKYDGQERYFYAAAGSTITLTCPDEYATDATAGRENQFYLYNYFKPETKSNLSSIVGDQLTLGNEDITILAGKNIRRGDANNDASLNIFDGLLAAQSAAGKTVTINEMAADVDSNGVINVQDAYQIISEWLNGAKGKFFDSTLPTAKRDDYIKVCSYNIKSCHYDPMSTYKDGSDQPYDNGIPMERYDDVLDEILKVDADIYGFQEVDRNNKKSPDGDQMEIIANELTKATGETYYSKFFLTVPDGNSTTNGYGHGIVTKYKIIESGIVEIRFAGMCKENGTRFDALEPRGFGKYPLDVNGDGDYDKGVDIMFYNCHLAELTYEQLDFMADYMEADIDAGHLVISTGDYNLQAYEMKGAFDTEKLTALNGGDQFNSFRYTTNGTNTINNILIGQGIEHYWNEGTQTGIFSSNTLYDYTINDEGNVIDQTTNISTASDHLAIWTYIKNPAK